MFVALIHALLSQNAQLLYGILTCLSKNRVCSHHKMDYIKLLVICIF